MKKLGPPNASRSRRKTNGRRKPVQPKTKPGSLQRSNEVPAAGSKSLPVVGIGASAGGLEAFTELLRAVPVDTGMAFVLVQHLEPKHESMLTKLLAKATRMPVQEVREGMRAEANHVYVIPANADLSLVDGLLHVVGRKAPSGLHLPIDYFFRSLAESRKSQAIGVILSGTASDGTAGLKAIKVEGGITMAQEPASARFDGMPRSAIAAGCVDLVLPPESIAAELARIARHPFVSVLTPEAVESLPTKEEDWARLFRLLRTASGVDFSSYKKSTINRRLARRMALQKLDSLSEYLKFLDDNREELNALFSEILIHVTDFFRDPDVFTHLRDKIFPRLLAGRTAGEAVRVWVPGCSTGEEAYSIAICLLEYLGESAPTTLIQIFGTDISDAAIETARAGVYSENDLREVSPQRRSRFFTKIDGKYTVNSALREQCVFARHDVTKDPPFSKLDLISCRNVLIYFEPSLQRRALASFHFALKDHGMLLLGKSESLSAFVDLFTPTDRKHKFFAKNTTIKLPLEMTYANYGKAMPQVRAQPETPSRLDLEREADRIVWERYAHAGLVVNDELQILHFRGDTSPYLQPSPGKANFSLSKMLREELQLEVRSAISEARKSGRRVRRQGVPFESDHRGRNVSFEVCPLPATTDNGKCFLILFEEPGVRGERRSSRDFRQRKGKKPSAHELQRLQNELERSREHLQAVIREHETTNEELKTANEEALSSMEELQSTNEELETAKEELQSSNEELVTLNEQLQNRNAELSRLSDDLSNVISGVDIPIVILDSDRCIRRFNSPAQEVLGLLPADIGRPVGSLHLGFAIPDLRDLISSVIDQGADVGREVQGEGGRWYSLRVRPFRTGEQKIEGALLAFVDIHELKQNEEALQRERNFISAILDAAKDLLVVVLDRQGQIVQFNRTCQALTGYSVEEVRGRHPWDFLAMSDEKQAIEQTFKEVLGGMTNQTESHWIAKDGRRLFIGWSSSPAVGDGHVEAVIATGIDHSERAEARLRVQQSEATVRALLENAAQAILAIDARGTIVLANVTAERMFGYSREELISQSLEKLLPERFRQRHANHLSNWFLQPRNRQMGKGLELAGLQKGGREFPVEIGLSYISSGNGVLGVAFISDITERKKNEEALLDYQQRLQKLTSSLLNVQESENRALARELHDVFSQELAALSMEVSTLLGSAEVSGSLTEQLANLRRKIGKLADEMHGASRQLHPEILHELGLEAALREECDIFSQQSGIPIKFTCEDMPAALPGDVSLCLYRVAQESLQNIRKHSGATDARMRLAGQAGGVALQVEDIGDGFDVNEGRSKGGLGLISMEERVRTLNGKFQIRSQPGVGTTVEVLIPLKTAR